MFYHSLRVGKYGKTFNLLKFRTFKKGQDGGAPTASADDSRMTGLGKFLRRTKLDELPTLINLLVGDIAIVGPRPDVPSEIDSLHTGTRNLVLSVKPGLISPATLWDLNEDILLKGEADPHKAYCERIKPTKYALNCWYVRKKSLMFDLRVLLTAATRFMGLRIDIFRIFPQDFNHKI